MTESFADGRMPGDVLLVRNLQIAKSHRGQAQTPIVLGASLSVRRGEVLAVVGESGSGKTVTARAIMGLLPSGLEASGEIWFEGRNLLELTRREMSRVRGRGLAMMMQDPFTMLSPVRRCGSQLVDSLRVRGRLGTRQARRDEVKRRLEEVGLSGSVFDKYPFQLSGGMNQRVALAAAMASEPAVLIADEPSTALDVATQRDILDLLITVQATHNMGVVLITHDLRIAFERANRISVLYAGGVLEEGPSALVQAEPLHPYTRALMLAEPDINRRTHLEGIPGSVPAAGDVSKMCAFAPRCPYVEQECRAARPALAAIDTDRQSSCRRICDIRSVLRARAPSGMPTESDSVRLSLSSPLLRVSALSKTFVDPWSRSRHQALAQVSLEIGERECVALVGESGSGKTTLGRCLVGLEEPDDGTITVNHISWRRFADVPPADRRYLRQRVQIIFQNPYASLNPSRTVAWTLTEAINVAGDDSRDDTPQRLLERVRLSSRLATAAPAALSGGERQRVAIARAIALAPSLLVCDEPLSGLDMSVQADIVGLFQDLKEEFGLAYLFITHDLAIARQVADRIVVLKDGTVVEHGDTDAILTSPSHAYTRKLIGAVPPSTASSSPKRLVPSRQEASVDVTPTN